jgi:hypothetical protein
MKLVCLIYQDCHALTVMPGFDLHIDIILAYVDYEYYS